MSIGPSLASQRKQESSCLFFMIQSYAGIPEAALNELTQDPKQYHRVSGHMVTYPAPRQSTAILLWILG